MHKSSFENTLQPASLAVKSPMFGHVKRSGCICTLSRLKSPHGLHVPSAFFTICRGDAQLESDRLTIPCFSMSRNSLLAASSLAASTQRYLAATGRPTVSMWCNTECLTAGNFLDGLITSGNFDNNVRSLLSGPPCPLSAGRLSGRADVVEGDGEEPMWSSNSGRADVVEVHVTVC